jgi:hypothetical protein
MSIPIRREDGIDDPLSYSPHGGLVCHSPLAAPNRPRRLPGSPMSPGGYLFVSGVDLDVRSKVAQELG